MPEVHFLEEDFYAKVHIAMMHAHFQNDISYSHLFYALFDLHLFGQ